MTNSFVKYWAPLYVYAGVIFYFSSISKPLPSINIPFFDKAMHMIEYSIFGYLAARALKNSPRKKIFENFKILAVLFSIFYGISDEFHQGFVSDRTVSALDVVADTIGGIAGTVAYSMSLRTPQG